MPIYIYQVLTDDGSEGEIFEIEQSMTTESLTKHPVTGQSIKRIYLPPNISKKHTPGQTQKKLDNRNIEKAGFSKYERDKLTGTYHKIAGKEGPSKFNN